MKCYPQYTYVAKLWLSGHIKCNMLCNSCVLSITLGVHYAHNYYQCHDNDFYVLLKALPPVCMEYTVRGEC